MSELTDEQIKELNQERIKESNREKAELWKSQQEAAEEKGWWLFLRAHVGSAAVMKGQGYLAVEANNELLSNFIKSQDLPINEMTLETAFQLLRAKGSLAEPPSKYERKTDTNVSMITPQMRHESFERSIDEPKRLLGVSPADIKRMGPEQIRKLNKQYPGELDRILAGKQ